MEGLASARREAPQPPLRRARVLIAHAGTTVSADLVEVLEDAGHAVWVEGTARQALARLEEERPEALLLDLDLPDGGGLALCTSARSHTGAPILMLARTASLDVLLGAFAAGADDLVVWPCNPMEVCARIGATMRRVERQATVDLRVGGLHLDERRHEVRVEGRRVDLPPVEFSLLRHLMRHADRVVRRSDLLDAIWGVDFVPGSNVVDRHVAALRRRLGALHAGLIETVPRVGYRLRRNDLVLDWPLDGA